MSGYSTATQGNARAATSPRPTVHLIRDACPEAPACLRPVPWEAWLLPLQASVRQKSTDQGLECLETACCSQQCGWAPLGVGAAGKLYQLTRTSKEERKGRTALSKGSTPVACCVVLSSKSPSASYSCLGPAVSHKLVALQPVTRVFRSTCTPPGQAAWRAWVQRRWLPSHCSDGGSPRRQLHPCNGSSGGSLPVQCERVHRQA